MIVPLIPIEENQRTPNRRLTPRFRSAQGVLYADATASDGRRRRLKVADVSPRGVRLVGDLPVQVGDPINVGVQFDLARLPYDAPGMVVHRDEGGIGVRFATRAP